MPLIAKKNYTFNTLFITNRVSFAKTNPAYIGWIKGQNKITMFDYKNKLFVGEEKQHNDSMISMFLSSNVWMIIKDIELFQLNYIKAYERNILSCFSNYELATKRFINWSTYNQQSSQTQPIYLPRNIALYY